MFVDDSLFAQIRDLNKHSMAASIEALYIILGFPEIGKGQDVLSLDKYFQSVCSYERIQLGIKVNTRTVSIELTQKKFHVGGTFPLAQKRKSFILLQGVVLCGSLEF